jgi:hypothetical protein
MRGLFLGIAVLITVGGAVGCLHGSGQSGSDKSGERQATGGGHSGGEVSNPLRRPLKLPRVSADEPCPRTPGGRPNPDVAIALGSGPVYPVLGFEAGKRVVELTADELRGDSYWQKTLWAVDPEYDGPVLIRGRGISPPQKMGFGYDNREFPELRFPAHETDRWRYGPSVTILPGPGCYAFQVDGTDFSGVILFEAVLARSSASTRPPISPSAAISA